MKTTPIVLAAALLINGIARADPAQDALQDRSAATQNTTGAKLNTWLGVDESTLRQQKGAPNHETADGHGGKILVYKWTIPGTIIPGAPMPTKIGMLYSPDTVTPPVEEEMQFYVTAKGMVYGWRKGAESNFRRPIEEDSSPKPNAEPPSPTVRALNEWEDGMRKVDPGFGEITPVGDSAHGQSRADRVFDALARRAAEVEASPEKARAAATRAWIAAWQADEAAREARLRFTATNSTASK